MTIQALGNHSANANAAEAKANVSNRSFSLGNARRRPRLGGGSYLDGRGLVGTEGRGLSCDVSPPHYHVLVW
jgi:hypothetical protein